MDTSSAAGRPAGTTEARYRLRTREFLRLVAEGVPLTQAAADAGLSHARALKIVSEIGLEGLAALLPDEADAA